MKRTTLLVLIFGCALIGCGDDTDSKVSASTDVTNDATAADTASDAIDADISVISDAEVADTSEPSDIVTVDPFSEVEAFVIDQMNQAKIPGLAAAVTHQGKVVWTGAYGYANVEDKLAATVKTPFMLASVSKTVTGVAVMHAQEEGALSLTDSVNDVLPFTVDNPRVDGEDIQVRHLVSHTSGIRDNWGNMPYFDGDPTVPLGEFVEGYLVEGGQWYDATANFNATMPGEAFDYGNVATALAGFVVEHTTQTPFDDYCDTHIFDVLDMKRTGWHLEDFDAATVAMPYEVVGGNFKTDGHYGYADYPDGQLRSSISDIARFLAAISNGGEIDGTEVLTKESVDTLLTAPVPGVDKGQFVFWYESTIAGQKVIGHNGGDIGVATQVSFSPETGTGVIVLMNVSWSDPVTSAAGAIQTLLYETADQL